MGWREDIRGPASFRGVPFYVDTSERSGSRRIVLHEFPGRDTPYAEDGGRGPRAFPVEGYVLGEDYLVAKHRLIAALEEEGPGELVHPYYGTKRVVAHSFRVRESSQDGGIARFAIDFTETEERPSSPTSVPSARATVNLRAEAALAAKLAAVKVRNAVSFPAAALDSLGSVVKDAARALEGALAPVAAATQELADLKRKVDNLVLVAATLARQPADAVTGFQDVVSSLGTSPAGPVIDALLGAYAFVPAALRPPASTATRLEEQEAYDLLLGIVRTVEVVAAARLAPDAKYDSYEDAVATRDAICTALDDQIELADDATFAALMQLRADLVRAVPGEESDLPRLARYTPAVSVPSLVLAYRLYGDLSREADVVARNKISHPSFVVGGTELEVLSDG